MALDDFRQDPLLLSRGIVRSSSGDYFEVPLTSIQYWRDEDPEPTSIQQIAPQAPDPEEGVGFGDYARSIMAGGAQVAQGIGWLTRMAGAEDVGRAIEELGSNAVDHWNSGLSDPAKDALSREFVRKNEGGEWEWGDANLHTVGLFGAQSLLGTAAGAGAGAGLTKVLQTFANPFGRAALTEAVTKGATALPAAAAGDAASQAVVRTAAAAAKKLRLVDRVLGASGFGLGEGAIGGMTAGVDVYQSVLKLPPEKLLQNDRYQQVFASTDETLSELERHQYAAETVAREASSLTGLQAGLTTALLGAPMGAFFGSILGKKALGAMAQTTPRAIATGAAGEALQEFAQGGAETIIANRQRAIAGEDIELFEGALNQAIGGALAGAPLGGALGAMDVPTKVPHGSAASAGKASKTGPAKAQHTGPRLDPLRTVATEAFKAGVPQEEILETVERVKKGEEPVLVAVGKLRKRQMGFAGAQATSTQQPQAAEPTAPAEPATTISQPTRTIEDAEVGAETTVTGEKPMRARFQLVDVNTLVTSHDIEGRANAAFPQELQPRDRSRSASRQWIEETTAKFQHEPMIEGVEAGSGPPIVDADRVVESGNGRANLLRNVYAKGKGDAYKAYLKAHAARFGIDPAAVEKMDTPVLVRVRQDPLSIEERIEFTQAANRPTVAAMSPSERARADAQMLDDDQLARLNVPDDGNVLAGSNAEFVGRFLQELPATERGGLLTAEGQPTKQVADRIKAALFAKAYDDDRLLALMAEDADPDVANVVSALVKAAPAFAKVDEGFDVAGPLVEGVEVVRAARKSGQAVDEYLRQQGLFGQTSAEAGRVASFLGKNIRSAKRMSEALIEIARYAEQVSNPTGDLLGDPLPRTLDAALNAATARMAERYPETKTQGSLFSAPAPAKPATPAIEVTRDASLSDEDKAIEARLARKLEADPVAAEREYAQLTGTMGGKMLNTDIARELSPDYLSDRKKSAAVHEPASSFTKWLFARRLAEQPAPGDLAEVVFTAGGTGAGKTSSMAAVIKADPDVARAQVIFDTNMNGVESSRQKIDQALAAGKSVTVVYTFRDPVDSLVNGAIPRSLRQAKQHGTGRTVPLTAHAETHVGARNAMEKLQAHYAGDKRVKFRVVDNSHGKNRTRLTQLEKLPRLAYDSTLRALHEALDQQRTAGRIPEDAYRAFGGQQQADAGRERQESGPARAGDREGAERNQQAARGRAPADAVAAAPVEETEPDLADLQEFETDEEGVVRDLPLYSRAPESSPSGGSFGVMALRRMFKPAIDELSPLIQVSIQADPERYGFPRGVQGAFIPGEGVLLFADSIEASLGNAPNAFERAREIFVHEVFGHFAMERTPFGEEAVRMVLSMHGKKHASIEPLWDEVAVRWGKLDEVTHAKEVIAVMAERGDKHAVMTRLIAGVRRFLRKLGIVRDYSDAEVRDLIARAARAMRVDVNTALAGSPKLQALNPSSSDADILAALDEAIPPDVVAIDAHLSRADRAEPLFSRAATADPAIQAIIDRVLTKAPEEFTLKDRVRSMWADIAGTQGLAVKQGLIDSFASVEALERDFTGGQLLDASQSAYKAMLATKNLPSVMAAVMMNGVPEFRSGAYMPVAGRKGIIEIFKPLTEHKDGNLLRQWELFAAANRANRLIKEKNPDGTRRENLFTQAEIDEALKLEQKYPVFRQVLSDWNAFNKQMLDLAQDAGLLDPASRAVWEKNDYVPFYRAVEDFQGPRKRRGVAGQRADIKTLKGEDKPLGNVFENMMLNTAHLLDASFKNRAMQRVVGLAVGNALQPVPFAAEAIEVTDDQLARALTKAGLIVGNPVTGLGGIQVVQAMTPQQKAHWSTIFRRVAPKGPNIVSVMANGKPEYYEVTDPLVLSSIAGMGYDNFADIWGLFRGSKKLLTSAVTADPAFMLANWVRDTLSTWVVSDASMHPFIDAIKGAKAALSKDPTLLQMMMAGAGGGGFYDSNPDEVRKLIATKVPTGTKGFTDTIIDTPHKAWQMWRKIGAAAENANRIAVFKAVLAKGGTVGEAAYQARDVLNFAMSGDYAAMRWLTQTVPFLNARVQGLYRLFRGARDNKKGFFLKGMTLLAATMALALRNNDRDEYEELPEWDKDLYWHFFVGDQHFRLPKPFEVGAMFATVPERIWRAASGRDSAKILWQRLFQMAADTFAFNPVPQLVKPVIEQYANRSMFTGSPIVGMAEQKLDPEAQFTPWTSETMRALAQALPDFAPAWLRSPARLEAALRAYTGSMGMYVLDVSDALVREALGYPESPSKKLHDLPVVKRFLANPNPRHTKYADLMYEMLDQSNATYSTINRFRREQRFEEATDLQQANKSKLAVRVRLNRVATQVRNINQQIRLVQLSKTISAKDKRARIDTLVDRKNRLTRQVAPWSDLF